MSKPEPEGVGDAALPQPLDLDKLQSALDEIKRRAESGNDPAAELVAHLLTHAVALQGELDRLRAAAASLRGGPQPNPPELQRLIDCYGADVVAEIAAALRAEFGTGPTPQEK